MKISKQKQRCKYLLSDLLTSALSICLLNMVRYHFLVDRSGFTTLGSYLFSANIIWGQVSVCVGWLVLYYYSGYYNSPIQRSRLHEFITTLYSIVVGILVVFFALFINDSMPDYHQYYYLICYYFGIHFLLTYTGRWCITQQMTTLIHHRKFGFNTLVIGTGSQALSLVKELNGLRYSLGFKILGYIETEKEVTQVPQKQILGDLSQLKLWITQLKVEKLIIALETDQEKDLFAVLKTVYQFGLPIIVPTTHYPGLTQPVRMSTIYATPMVEITEDYMPDWQKNIKESYERVIALIVLTLSIPFFLYIGFRIKKESKGAVFYRQERLGLHSKPFQILKFRSMITTAEEGEPQLSSIDDERVTSFGRFLRKYRLDELPQFWNVLKGEMSLVGPRPERAYFVSQIVKQAPQFYLLYKIKPGITSWGMVRYGYANTIPQMIERLKYDLIYLENRSLLIDLKILIYTIKTVVTGRGI